MDYLICTNRNLIDFSNSLLYCTMLALSFSFSPAIGGTGVSGGEQQGYLIHDMRRKYRGGWFSFVIPQLNPPFVKL
jgi:hypothetical protein